MAARYQPADGREQVGGDWYDVTLILRGIRTGTRSRSRWAT